MSHPRTHPVAVVIAALLLISYFAGYLVLRAHARSTLGMLILSPSRMNLPAGTLTALYEPMFYADRKLTGRRFGVLPMLDGGIFIWESPPSKK